MWVGATDPVAVGRLYATDPEHVRVYRLPLLREKVSLPRPVVQGSVGDRDMHAGQQYVPLLDLFVPERDQAERILDIIIQGLCVGES